MNPKVDAFLSEALRWQQELGMLRRIVLDCQLNEELKWKQPCYTFNGNNITLLAGFKDYCAISFFKGVLLKDDHGILQTPGENSQAVRLVRFQSQEEISKLEPVVKAYIYEAIEVEKAGLKVNFKKSKEQVLPDELLKKMDEDPAFKRAFYALTPGRQRGYNLYFSAPKQSATRESRIEKYEQRILDGIGFHDCVCGRSKKLPRCDGSHKYI